MPELAMPDTLAHFGTQILISKAIIREADCKWIGLGCLLPDLPWIAQRAVQPFGVADPVTVRLYAVIQSSLLFSLLLAAAVSLQAEHSRRVFLLLALNCLLHLLLDPLEIKWGNGTMLFAPFSWQLTQFALFWPEDLPSLLLAAAGLFMFPIAVWQDRKRAIRFISDWRRQLAGAAFLLWYLLLPPALFSGPLRADSHYAATMRSRQRTGKLLELERRPFKSADQTLLAYSGETLHLSGSNLPEQDGLLSLQGRFVAQQSISVSAWHLHSGRRDLRSQIGIFLLLAAWSVALRAKRITICRPSVPVIPT